MDGDNTSDRDQSHKDDDELIVGNTSDREYLYVSDLGAVLAIVDDEEISRESLNDILGQEFHVHSFSNSNDAFDFMTSERFRLNDYRFALVDIQMPEEDGLSLLDRLESAEKEAGVELTPAIVLSGAVEQTKAAFDSAKHSNVVEYMGKPIDMMSLRLRIRRELKDRYQEKAISAEAERIHTRRAEEEGRTESTLDEQYGDWFTAERRVLKKILVYAGEKKVLHVADDIDKALMYRVKGVTTESEARRELEENDYDVVIAPFELGKQIRDEIKKKGSSVVCLYDREPENSEFLTALHELDAKSVISNPLDSLDVVRGVLERESHRMMQDKERLYKDEMKIKCFRDLVPKLTWKDFDFSTPEYLKLIAFAIREGLLKNRIMESPESTDQYAEGLAASVELDRDKQYDPDKKILGFLEHGSHARGYNLEVARKKYENYMTFQDDPNFRVPEVMSLIEDEQDNVGYIRREFVIGPTVAEALLRLNEGVKNLEDSLNVVPEVDTQKIYGRIEDAKSLRNILIDKAVKDMVYWQENIRPEDSSEESKERLREYYGSTIRKSLDVISRYTEVKFSGDELELFDRCLDTFVDRIYLDENTYAVKMDATPWNMALRTGKMNMTFEELIDWSKEEEKVSEKKVESRFYHFDLGSDTGQVCASILEDLWHFVDSYEAGMKGTEIWDKYYDFMYHKHPEGSHERAAMLESRMSAKVGEPGAVESMRLAIGPFDKSNEEMRVYRNLRKAALELDVYELWNLYRFRQGKRDKGQYQRRHEEHKGFTEHHLKKMGTMSLLLSQEETDFVGELCKEHDSEALKIYHSLKTMYADMTKGKMTSHRAKAFGQYLDEIERYDGTHSDRLLELGKLFYLDAIFSKVATFNKSMRLDYSSIK